MINPNEPSAFQYIFEGIPKIIGLRIRLFIEDIGSIISGLIEDIVW